ncbi:MAG: hypothetical protein ACX94C_04750 [Phycisphaerales bacterium]
MNKGSETVQRRGVVLVVIVVIMAILSLVVAGAIRPVRDEAEVATLRIETTRAFYAAESGAFVLMNAVMGRAEMPTEGDTLNLGGQTIEFIQTPGDDQPVAIIEGRSGDALRRIEMMTE